MYHFSYLGMQIFKSFLFFSDNADCISYPHSDKLYSTYHLSNMDEKVSPYLANICPQTGSATTLPSEIQTSQHHALVSSESVISNNQQSLFRAPPELTAATATSDRLHKVVTSSGELITSTPNSSSSHGNTSSCEASGIEYVPLPISDFNTDSYVPISPTYEDLMTAGFAAGRGGPVTSQLLTMANHPEYSHSLYFYSTFQNVRTKCFFKNRKT